MTVKTASGRLPKIPDIPWEYIARRISRYWQPEEYNPHKGLLGNTRSGKTYLIRHGIMETVPDARAVVIDIKPGGEKTWNGWGNDITELSHGFGNGPDGSARYRLLAGSGNIDDRKGQVQKTLDIIAAEGECVLIMDDSRRITSSSPGFGLYQYVDLLLSEGAAIGISVILAANSTVWATSTLRDQCSVYLLGTMGNESERNKFAQIVGLDKQYREILGKLPPRRFLYSDKFDGEIKLAVTGI